MHERMKKKQAKNYSGALPPAFKAMADSTRLKILLMLEGRPRTVTEIVEFFHLSQPTISRHMQTLAGAKLVQRTKKGQKVYYEIDPKVMRSICVSLATCFPCCSITIEKQIMGGAKAQACGCAVENEKQKTE